MRCDEADSCNPGERFSVGNSSEISRRLRQDWIFPMTKKLALFFVLLAVAVPVHPQTPVPPAKKIPWPGKVELPVFVHNNPGQMFSEYKIYNAQGLPTRMPHEDWAHARQLVQQDPAWQAWLKKTRAAMDDWMAKRRDHVEWTCGWFHDFVSPKDGSHLIWTPDFPGATVASSSDPAVRVTPKILAGWVYNFRTIHANKMVEAARLYRLTGEKNYAAWAAAQLDFYADHYTEWPVFRGSSRIMWQSLDEAVNLIKYVQTARHLGYFATQERKAKWTEKLLKPDADLLERSGQTIQNIPCWQRSAEAVVALYCNDQALWEKAINGPFGVRNQIAKGITDDYIWYEQSLGYNDYVVLSLSALFREALLAGRGESLRPMMESVENLMLAPIALRFPTGQLPNPADSGKAGMVPDWGLLLDTADVFPTKLILQKLSTTKNWLTLLDPPAQDNNQGGIEMPPVVSRKMESTRFVILHAAPWQVFFHFGQLGSAHAQAEALNYEAFYENTDITHDPGTVGYGSPLSSGFYRQGVCANEPLVDGLGEESWHPGRLVQFSATSATANQLEYRKNAEASRILTITGNQLTDTVTVRTLDQKNHALGFVLNLQGKVRLSEIFADDPSFGTTRTQTGFEYWTKTRTAHFKDKTELLVDYKGLVLRVELKLPGEFTLTCGSAPDYPPARRDALYLETQGQAATLSTRFVPMVNQ